MQTIEDIYAATGQSAQDSPLRSPRSVGNRRQIMSEPQSSVTGPVTAGINNFLKEPGKKGNAAAHASPGKSTDAAAAPKQMQRTMSGSAAEIASRQLQQQQVGLGKKGARAPAAAAPLVSAPPLQSMPTAQEQLEYKLAQETRDAREVERCGPHVCVHA